MVWSHCAPSVAPSIMAPRVVGTPPLPSAGVIGTPPPVTLRPPGLRDRVEPVLHSYDGELCGGTPDTTLVAKLISKFRVEFEEDDDVFTWIQKRKQFINELRCTMPAATMYTMVCLHVACVEIV